MPTEALDSVGPSPSHFSGDPSPSHLSSNPSPSHISGAPSRSHLSGASFSSHSSVDSSFFQPLGLFGGIYIFCSRSICTVCTMLGEGALAIEGPLGELQRGGSLMENNGMSPSSEDMAWDLLQITLQVSWALYQKCILTYQWERTEKTDREMLAHMSAMHHSWRSKKKKRHFNGKSLDDAIASLPTGVNSSDWQTMCGMWTTRNERRVADRNKQNCATQ
ncbi:hypothetical protein Taro_005390 [Colocasia esculenta]|uniref:Uncharacterized protein n=1 Tax=Colocasia esculenta TaxID=4460 RepID=A0A843TPR3_COLES|nr:hypothetical protein [Colocasia esculenta]